MRHALTPLIAATLVIQAIALPAVQDGVGIRPVDRTLGRDVAVDDLIARIANVDVLLIGGTTDDAASRRVEARLIDALASTRTGIALALEVFDRQAQEPFDHFQMGHLSEAEFLADVRRPSPDYARDYRAIVDAAIARQWPIVAAAAPRPIVEAVAADGLDVLERLPASERSLVAGRHACADVHHPGARHLPGPHSNVAFCLESETIAESIAQAHAAGVIGGGTPLVIALVQDSRLGHLERFAGDVMQRLPGRTVLPLSIVAVPDVQAVSIAPNDMAVPRFVVYVQP